MLEVEGVELLADAAEDNASLQTLFVARSPILGSFLSLLLGLLRPGDALLP